MACIPQRVMEHSRRVYVNRFYARFDGKVVEPKQANSWLIIMPGEAMAASYRAKPDTLFHFTADQNVSPFWTQSTEDQSSCQDYSTLLKVEIRLTFITFEKLWTLIQKLLMS